MNQTPYCPLPSNRLPVGSHNVYYVKFKNIGLQRLPLKWVLT